MSALIISVFSGKFKNVSSYLVFGRTVCLHLAPLQRLIRFHIFCTSGNVISVTFCTSCTSSHSFWLFISEISSEIMPLFWPWLIQRRKMSLWISIVYPFNATLFKLCVCKIICTCRQWFFKSETWWWLFLSLLTLLLMFGTFS